MIDPVVYIFLNKSLHMSIGKAAAQAAHAAILVSGSIDQWEKSMHRTIIILEARDERHIRAIEEYLDERGFNTHKVIDEGVNEIDPHTVTALSTEVLEKNEEDVVKAFSSFKLYKEIVKHTLEFEI